MLVESVRTDVSPKKGSLDWLNVMREAQSLGWLPVQQMYWLWEQLKTE